MLYGGCLHRKLLVCIEKQDSVLIGPFETDAGWKKNQTGLLVMLSALTGEPDTW